MSSYPEDSMKAKDKWINELLIALEELRDESLRQQMVISKDLHIKITRALDFPDYEVKDSEKES